jgi:hypothetical protein
LKKLVSFTIILWVSLNFFTSCKKDKIITNPAAQINFSADTIKFDTVFTTVGSVTKSLKVINNNEGKIIFDQIKLMGGNNSAFKININGIATLDAKNITLSANDSLYIFISVTINPSAVNLPFIVSDSILFSYNGQNKYMQLQAYGKNAIFLNNALLLSNATFTSSLPYVILGGLQIGNAATLTLNAGTQIYAHADAPIIIDGTLIANGTKTQPIVFTGDRLDEPYLNFPASWPGIFLRASSKNNFLQFVQIKNAYQALAVLQPSGNINPKLILKQSKIDNAFDAGISATNTHIVADNTLISNCGKNIDITFGGTYNFTHCTIAAYSNNYVVHKNASIFITDANANNQTNTLTAVLRNSIFYGDAGFVQNEIETLKKGNAFAVNIENCLFRNNADPANATITQSLKNIDPAFDSINNFSRVYDFNTTKNPAAPGLNKAVITPFMQDLNGNNRNVGLPDIGAFEKQ